MTIFTDIPFRSRFIYGIGGAQVDWTTTLPIRSWNRATGTTSGGSRTSAAGIPAAYIVRRDHNLSFILRLYEEEWPDLHGLLQWGQYAESFLWYPDAGGTVIADPVSVWLESPKATVDISPTRSAEFPRILEQEIMLRKLDDEPWDILFYPEPT